MLIYIYLLIHPRMKEVRRCSYLWTVKWKPVRQVSEIYHQVSLYIIVNITITYMLRVMVYSLTGKLTIYLLSLSTSITLQVEDGF